MSNQTQMPPATTPVVPAAKRESATAWIWKRPSFWTGLCAILVYCDSRALHGGWVYDDAGSVVRNIVVNGQVPWNEVWTRDFWGSEMKAAASHKSFRPITTLTFKLNYLLAEYFKADPDEKYPPTFTFHLFNVFLHGIVTALITEAAHYVFTLGYPSKGGKSSSNQSILVMQLIVGAIFGLHPVHSEVVSNITSRGELLMSTFMLIAFLSYAKTIRKIYDEEEALREEQQIAEKELQQTTATGNDDDNDDNQVEPASKDGSEISANDPKEANKASTTPTDDMHKSSSAPSRSFISTIQNIVGIYMIPWLGMTLSLFSKEQGATTLISLVLWDFLYHHRNVVTLWKQLLDKNVRAVNFTIRTILLAVQTLLICYWRYILNGESSPDFIQAQNPAGFAPDRLTRTFSIPWVYCLYIRDAVYPKYLCPDWSGISIDLISSLTDPRCICVIALWYLTGQSFWSMVVGLPKQPQESPHATPTSQVYLDDATLRIVNMAVWAFAFSPFLLSSNILVVVGLMKADRVIYLPLFGYCIIQALVMEKLCMQGSVTMPVALTTKKQSIFWLGHLIFMLQLHFYCAKTHERNLAWSSALSLWEQAYFVNPRSHHTRYNYGYELSIVQRYEEAEEALRPIGSARIDGPSNTFVYAMVLFNLKRCTLANELLDEAFEVIEEKRQEGGLRNTESALKRAESNLLVVRAHCLQESAQEKGRILYEAVQVDPSNDYAIGVATEMMEKIQKMEELKKQYGLSYD